VPTERKLQHAAAQTTLAGYQRSVNAMIKSGVEKYGEGFHGMCNDLVDHAGKDSVDGLNQVLMDLDDPASAVAYLSPLSPPT
jgi:hypothetical protein